MIYTFDVGLESLNLGQHVANYQFHPPGLHPKTAYMTPPMHTVAEAKKILRNA